MTASFDLSQHDNLFASRASDAEWARIKAFRDRPLFLNGVRRHTGVMQPFFAYNFILNKVVVELWRFQMLVLTLYLYETRSAGDPRSGLTLGNLQRICTQMSLASPGRVFAFLNVMKVGGYLASAPDPQDRRIVRLAPTPLFMEIVEEWNLNIFATLDATLPDGELQKLADLHPSLGRGMRTSGAEGLIAGWVPLGPFPEVFHFATTDGGWSLMEFVAEQSIAADNSLRTTPVSVDLRQSAKQFGGSRTNLIRCLESGYEQGLLDAPPRLGKDVQFSTRMLCAYFTFLASYLGHYDKHTRIGLARLLDRQDLGN